MLLRLVGTFRQVSTQIEPPPDSPPRPTHPDQDRVRPVPLWTKIAIRWRHRHQYDPDRWSAAIAFDELVWSNRWDLANSFDDLNDRYESYR